MRQTCDKVVPRHVAWVSCPIHDVPHEHRIEEVQVLAHNEHLLAQVPDVHCPQLGIAGDDLPCGGLIEPLKQCRNC